MAEKELPSCLIGYSGFVGGNLRAQHEFDILLNSANFEQIRGGSFGLVVCAGAYARKWYANQHPEEDKQNIETLISLLQSIKAQHLLLISTVDVYPTAAASGADESFDCASCENHVYGKNRLWLEEMVASTFDAHSIIRLPGLFGPGLKKNVIFDLLHQNCLSQINLASAFQYFDLRQLWAFVSQVMEKQIRLVNIVTEPVGTDEIVERFFPDAIESCYRDESKAVRYDFRTQFDRDFGGTGGYMQTKARVLEQLESYISTVQVKTKLAVSNIAWNSEHETEVLQALTEQGVSAVEVAPSVVWPNWVGATEEAAAQYRRQLQSRGMQIVALQAILFAKPETTLFEQGRINQRFIDHMRYVARLAHALESKIVVFGAPKNRRRGDLSLPAALALAAPCLSDLGNYFFELGTCLCVEPNPPQYDCDFITNSFDAVQLIDMAGSKGFKLHLDSACLTLAGENIATAFANAKQHLRHFHASEPQLANFDRPTIDHAEIAAQLVEAGYEGYVSIEMRQTPVASIRNACQFVLSTYLGARELCKLP